MLITGSGIDGFRAAFAFIGLLATLGVLTAAVGFARRARPGAD